MVGIDISHHQATFPEGDWEFVVVKATEGVDRVDNMFASHWKNAARFPRRGVFHYALGELESVTQATFFADKALARGFKPGVDMWQLDVERKLNESVPSERWRTFIPEFMEAALGLLGRFGFLYIGFDFYPDIYGAHDLTVLRRFNWWMPSYRENDGEVHPFHHNVPAELVVIHQFTSVRKHPGEEDEGLDQNRIVDARKWADLTDALPTELHQEEDNDVRLVPRRAIAHPPHPGRVAYIRFDAMSKTLIAFNGLDFDRNQDPKVWKIADFAGAVTARLLLPVRGPLSYAETSDGGAVIITDDSDGGTFALPYKELAPA